jgi:hypothetical protein
VQVNALNASFGALNALKASFSAPA